MKFRKLITYAMITGVLVAQAPGIMWSKVQAASHAEAQVENEQGQRLTTILNCVKSKVRIPHEYTEFVYSVDEMDELTNWYFTWSQKDGEDRIELSCDNKGNINRYNIYHGGSREQTKPCYLKSELKGKADAFLKKIDPEKYDSMVYQEEAAYSLYNHTYVYTYQRTKNHIPVDNNQCSVRVDSVTGEVIGYYSNMDYEVILPSDSGKITKEKATEIIKQSLEMKLEYHMTYSDDAKKMKGELLYVPNQEYYSVDALSGALYTERSGIEGMRYGMADKEEAAESMNGMGMLTEQEISKVNELSHLITKEQALSAVKKNKGFLIDKNANTMKAWLYEQVLDESKPEKKSYVWVISCTDERKPDYESGDSYRPYYSATVDASTGKVLNFRASVKSENEAKEAAATIKYSEEQGVEIAKKFLKQYDQKLFDNTQLTDSDLGYVLSYNIDDMNDSCVYGGKVYTFTRMEHGIECPENYIKIGVDLVTGKVYTLNKTWYTNIQFESSDNVITPETARENYLACEGFNLTYELMYSSKENASHIKRDARLVYSTEIIPSYIDAHTGKQASYDGTEYTAGPSYRYDDISGYVYAKDIQLLADMGIGFDGCSYLPNEPITREEMERLVTQVIYNYNNEMRLEGKETFTRQDAARYAITTCGLNKVAELDVYKNKYTDADQIEGKYLGYLVLAGEFDMLVPRADGSMAPKEALTRGEAAHMVLMLMGACVR